ncbi:MAG: hypothetical protein JWM91_3506 [Rhodospirillales bacterium]|nr:hypothetical protein [Rhodospirillales bacterium]
MMIRILAVAAFATMSVAAQAGTLTNGAWTPSGCGSDPGPAPEMEGASQASYSKSAKTFQAWQDKAKVYEQCLSNEAKTDQSAIVESANKSISAINDGSNKFVADANAAVEKLKKKGGK